MDEFLSILQQHIDVVGKIADQMENGENYFNELQGYLSPLNQMITEIFELMNNPQIQLEVNRDFILQVLNDIAYGMEQEDRVFLLDVLRYGLLEIYYYIGTELRSVDSYESTGV